MAGLKGVIFSLRGVLVQEKFDRELFQRTINLIRFLQGRGVKPVFASNSRWELIPSGKKFEDLVKEHVGDVHFYYGGENMDWKPRAKAIADILDAEGWAHTEVVYVGNTVDDMKTASNGRVMFLNALWHGQENPYGFRFDSPEDIGRFIDCLCLGLDDWFWAVEKDGHRIYALGPFSTMSERYREAFAYSAGAKATAKFAVEDDEFWGRLLAARVYLSGLVDEIDFVTCYPGHAVDSGPPQVEAALSILAGSVRKRYLPDLIVRHTTATKSQNARNSGQNIDASNQLTTIKLNKTPRKGLGQEPYKSPPNLTDKTILVVDDFCTAGHSFEGARAFIQAAGAKMIGLAWLKTINTAYTKIQPPNPVSSAYANLTGKPKFQTETIPYDAAIRKHGAMIDLAKIYESYQNWKLPS